MVIVKAKEQVNFDQFSNNTSEKQLYTRFILKRNQQCFANDLMSGMKGDLAQL